MATSERYRDRENNWVEQTEWHNVIIFGNLANDIAEKRRNYCKGDLMYVEGKLRTRQYVDSQGNNRYVTEVSADKMMQLSPGKVNQISSNTANYAPSDQSYVQNYPASDPNSASDNDSPLSDSQQNGGDLPF